MSDAFGMFAPFGASNPNCAAPCVSCSSPTVARNQNGEPLCEDHGGHKDDYSQRLRKEQQK